MDKKYKLGFVKAINPEERSVTAYVSTYEWDRTDERFLKGSWSLENFLKNPVVLLSHKNSEFPVAKSVMIQEDEHGLLAKTVFHEDTEEARTAFKLYQTGFLNAFSVGFIPKNYITEALPDGKGKGIVYTDAELYEYSVVSVPANPGAVIGREVAEMAVKMFGDKVVKNIGGDDFMVAPEMTETISDNPEDLDAALKNLHIMARTVRGKPLDESKLSLIKSTIDTLHEAITEAVGKKDGGVSPEDMSRLSEAIKSYAECLKSARPDTAQMVASTISQVAKALLGRTE